MELINKRYRIIKVLTQSRLSNSYLVNDIVKGVKSLQLNILNDEYCNKDLLNYYTENFISLTNINIENIVSVKNFGRVFTIDNKSVNYNLYFYTNEYMENNYNYSSNILDLSLKNRLNIFIEICQAMIYLHLKGFVYGDLNPSNILLNKSQDGIHLKLKDITTIELEKYDYWSDKKSLLVYKAPEVMDGNRATISSDIYSLGILLSKLNLKNLKMDILITNMTKVNSRKRLSNVTAVVNEINNIYAATYVPLKKEVLETLSFNTKLTGRDYEISQVLDTYNKINEFSTEKKYILIHGDSGVGKTRILNEVSHNLTISGANVFSSFAFNNFKGMSNKPILDILKKVIADCDAEVLEPYENEIVKILPEINKNKKIIPTEPLEGNKEKFRILNAVTNFLYEYIKDDPTVFIVDNFHMADSLSVEFLEHLYSKKFDNKKILFIISYCDEGLISNKKLSSLISNISTKKDILNLYIHALNETETIEMIKNILNMPTNPVNFGKMIFSKTYGNPLFIEESIKNLFSKKVVYINSTTGLWETNYNTNNYEKIPVPSSMEQAVSNQIKDLLPNTIKILNIVSIFYKGVSFDNISKLLPKSITAPNLLLNELVSKGILCEKIEDSGVVYDFYNRLLKELIYTKLKPQYKITMHENAAKILENSLENTFENHEELIYHLEKANNDEKVIFYCTENAERMLSLNNRQGGIINYSKALSILKNHNDLGAELVLSLKIGCIYDDDGDADAAINYYNTCLTLSDKLKNDKYKILIFNKLANIYIINKNDISTAETFLSESKKLLEHVNYKEGFLDYNRIKSKILYKLGKYDEAYQLCTDCIQLCGDEYLTIKANYYNTIGNTYLYTSHTEKALETYNKALEIFEQTDDKSGIILISNNIGVIYGDYYQDNQAAVSYFKQAIKICEENNMISQAIFTLSNLAESYLILYDYDKSLENFVNCYNKSLVSDFEGSNLYSAIYLILLYAKLNDYEKAFLFYNISREKLIHYPVGGANYSSYNYIYAEFFYRLGNMDMASLYSDIALSTENSDRKQTYDLLVLKEKINISSNFVDTSSYNSDNLLGVIDNYSSSLDKINALCDICTLLITKKNMVSAKHLYKNLENTDMLLLPTRLQSKILYLRATLFNPSDEMDLLFKAANIAKNNKQDTLSIKISSKLGQLFLLSSDYFYAVNYFFEACEKVKKLVVQLPDKYRIPFINNADNIKPFNMLMTIKNNVSEENTFILEHEYCFNITTKQELEDLLNYVYFKGLLKNNYILASAKMVFSNSSRGGISSIKDLLNNISNDAYSNLNLVGRYLANLTLASDYRIIIEDGDKNLMAVISSSGSTDILDIKHIIEKVKRNKSPYLNLQNTLITDANSDVKNLQFCNSVICLPVIMHEDNSLKCAENKRKYSYQTSFVKGYVYLESDKILNNFNKGSIKKCTKILKLLGFIIENYQLKISSSIDKLTGTLTRKYLEISISEQIEFCSQNNEYFSIIMFDLDHFKNVNDKYGHQTGDEVLKKVCKFALDNIRKDDSCGRYGGEEFIVVLPHTSKKEAFEVAENIRTKIEVANILGSKHPITISMGISSFPEDSQWKEDLISKADQALYNAKESGRNRTEIWNEEFSKNKLRTNTLSGIISGNTAQDSRNVEVILELLKLVKSPISKSEKIYHFLGRIIEIIESQIGMIFICKNGKMTENFARKAFEEEWYTITKYNEKILNTVVETKQGIFLIDWDEITEYDTLTGVPQWNSVVAVPLVNTGIVKGVLYLTVPIKTKEFSFNDFNFISFLADICTTII